MSILKAGLDTLKHRVSDAGNAIRDAQKHVTSAALEAAGMSERKGGHEEDLDEVLEHQKLDAFLRKAYAHSDKYMRAMNSMCGYTNLPHAHTPGPTPRARLRGAGTCPGVPADRAENGPFPAQAKGADKGL